ASAWVGRQMTHLEGGTGTPGSGTSSLYELKTGGAEPEAGAPPLISSPLAASRCVWPIHLPRSIWPCASTAAGRSFGMKTVAVIGASNNHATFGNKAVRAFLQQGYTVCHV